MRTGSRPSVFSGNCQASPVTRSTRARNSRPAPMGIWMGSAGAPSRARRSATALAKSAPGRSSWLTKAIEQTELRTICRQTVSDCAWTPATPFTTSTAPSSTRMQRSTSTVKSTWPGVSIRLIVWSRQGMLVAAALIVIPRRRSSSIQSMTALPSWTSPIRRSTPE